MALKQYTIESMSYLTTGLLDCGEEDASVEAAMCKVCTEQTQDDAETKAVKSTLY